MKELTKFYEDGYQSAGFASQRRFPNEELCRFMGRNLFSLDQQARSQTRILEVGCGSGGNLWMIAREGFEAHGLELSPAAVELCAQMLAAYNTSATLQVGDMSKPDAPDQYFDAVVDVFSSYCLPTDFFGKFLSEMHRILKPGGIFFSYFPSTNSDAFKRVPEESRIDAWTLDGITNPLSPFNGNHYPFRFLTLEAYRDALVNAGFEVTYGESVGRSYRDGAEYFEFLSLEAKRV